MIAEGLSLDLTVDWGFTREIASLHEQRARLVAILKLELKRRIEAVVTANARRGASGRDAVKIAQDFNWHSAGVVAAGLEAMGAENLCECKLDTDEILVAVPKPKVEPQPNPGPAPGDTAWAIWERASKNYVQKDDGYFDLVSRVFIPGDAMREWLALKGGGLHAELRRRLSERFAQQPTGPVPGPSYTTRSP